MANYTIDSMTYGSNTYTFTVPYGTCGNAVNMAKKTVTCANFTKLETGARIAVKFTYANSASSPTLNVNQTGDKPILAPGHAITDAWTAGSVIDFVYDGTNWCVAGHGVKLTYSYDDTTKVLTIHS